MPVRWVLTAAWKLTGVSEANTRYLELRFGVCTQRNIPTVELHFNNGTPECLTVVS